MRLAIFPNSSSPWSYGPERDTRTDAEKLSAAIDGKLAAKAALDAFAPTGTSADETVFGMLERAYEDADAVLVRFVEDATHVGYDRLLKAMAA